MIRICHIPSGNFHFRLPFSVNDSSEERKINVGGGRIISINNQESFKVENSTVNRSDLSEVYLHIKSSLRSSKIHEVNIFNEKQVDEQKKISDDLLNIYIPIGRPSFRGVKNSGFEDSAIRDANFLWLKEYKDKPFACYFENNTVFITGYLLSEDGEPNRVEAPSERLVPEDSALILDILATVDEDPDRDKKFFVLETYELRGGAKSDSNISIKEHVKKLDEIEYFSGSLTINYPLGFVENGNFIHGRKPENISISSNNTSQVYHARTIDDDGCPIAEKEDRRIFFITIN